MSIRQIAVLGAGLMGTNIALDFALAGYPVRLTDAFPAQLGRSRETAVANLGLLVQHAAVSEPEATVLGRIAWTGTIAETVSGADLVIEAVSEDLQLKRSLYGELAPHLTDTAILASNTSSFMPSLLADAAPSAERFLVAHYWNPAHLIPLVELVPSPRTAPEVLEVLRALYAAMGKQPVVVRKEALGFIGNRLQFALIREALSLVESGVATPEDIDTVIRGSFGLRLPVTGLFQTADLAGLDVLHAICGVLFPDLAANAELGPSMAALVAEGRLGTKTGAGWYDYAPGEAEALRARLGEELIRRRSRPRRPE